MCVEYLEGVEKILEDFLKHFSTWDFIKTAESYSGKIYITFKASVFNDLHVKEFKKLVRQHGSSFRLNGYGVRPISGDELLVTFVLMKVRA